MSRTGSQGRDGRPVRTGVVLLVLAALAWATTYGPPGTMTSIALAALAACALAAAGVVVLLVGLVLSLRRQVLLAGLSREPLTPRRGTQQD